MGARAFLGYLRHRVELARQSTRVPGPIKLPPPLEDVPPAQPPGFPFIALPEDSRGSPAVGYVRVNPERHAPSAHYLIEGALDGAIRAATAWFERIDPRVSSAAATVEGPDGSWGGVSAALAAMLAAVMWSLGGSKAPFGAIATGGWNFDDGTFEPVEERALTKKAEHAGAYGFRQLYAVSCDNRVREYKLRGVTVRALPRTPELAILAFLDYLGEHEDGDTAQAIVYLFDRFSIQAARSTPIPDDLLLQSLRRFRRLKDPLAQTLAMYSLGRLDCRRGRSLDAERMAEVVERRVQAHYRAGLMVSSTAVEYQLRVDRTAHDATVALDNGHWTQGSHPAWGRLARALRREDQESRRGKPLDPSPRLGRLVFRNVLSRRREYAARAAGAINVVLEEARLRAESLDGLGELARLAREELGRSDTTVSRQQNFLMDGLFAAWEMGARTRQLAFARGLPWFFVEGGGVPGGLTDWRLGNDFDRLTLLRYSLIGLHRPSGGAHAVDCLKWLNQPAAEVGPPAAEPVRILETICLYHPDRETRRKAAEPLRWAAPPAKASRLTPSIADLTALRSVAALAAMDQIDPLPDLRSRISRWRPSPLTEIARRILTAARTPREISARLPY